LLPKSKHTLSRQKRLLDLDKPQNPLPPVLSYSLSEMLYCLNPNCPKPQNPDGNRHCQRCGARLALRNRFKALKPLGKGGFGTTYLAQDLDNRAKHCVIKRFSYQGNSSAAADKAQQLFEQEAERLDHLNHPQIPRLLAYFQEDSQAGSQLYLVQEFIGGQTLQAELAQNGPLGESAIRSVLQGLLPILAFVHGRNVIHRDIKPDNIMRRKTGELVLIDFGIAKLLEQSALANTATTIGTPGFAAPEQTYGRVTPASDLFALGATCFELMTQAFSSGETEMLGYRWVDRWQQYVKPPLSPNMAAILAKLIEVNERSRYSNAHEVLQDLAAQTPASLIPQQSTPAQTTPQQTTPAHTTGLYTLAVAPSRSSSSEPNTSLTQFQSTPLQPTALQPTAIQPLAANLASPLAASVDTIQKVPLSRIFWLKYALLSYIGQALGFALGMVGAAFYAVAFQPSLQNDINAVVSLIRLMYWLVGGLVISSAQWIALRRWLPRALMWVPLTVASYWAIAFCRVAAGSLSIYESAAVGLFIGTLQWMALRKHSPRAGWWILWMIPMAIVLFRVLATNSYTNFLAWGSIGPLLDGCFLTWILRRRYAPNKPPSEIA